MLKARGGVRGVAICSFLKLATESLKSYATTDMLEERLMHLMKYLTDGVGQTKNLVADTSLSPNHKVAFKKPTETFTKDECFSPEDLKKIRKIAIQITADKTS